MNTNNVTCKALAVDNPTVTAATGTDAFVVFGNGNLCTAGTVNIGAIKNNSFNNNGYTLAVNGTVGVQGKITAEEVLVQATAWNDYVFNKNYKLKTLAESEAYIKANGHLEDVPSEAEVKEKGINVAEMNAILLKKIEELTLNVIELNKKVETLEKENQALK